MKIAVCIDDRNGMLFARRRQSMDSSLRRAFLAMTEPHKVWMDVYTAGQFTEAEERICVDDDFLFKAKKTIGALWKKQICSRCWRTFLRSYCTAGTVIILRIKSFQWKCLLTGGQ